MKSFFYNTVYKYSKGLLLLLMMISSWTASAVTYTVTTNADAGAGSLRDAITQANANAGADVINFAIGSGAATITLASALPTITNSIHIDGTTQPTYAGTPLIKIVHNGNILSLSSAHNSTIEALDLEYTSTALSGTGIYAVNCNVINVLNNIISNKRRGIHIRNGQDATITDNVLNNVSYDANHGGIELNNISSNTLPRSIIIQGNTFTGTNRMYTAIYLTNIHDQVISDGSVTGTNIFMPSTMGHQLFHSYPIRLYNTDRTTVSNVDLGYTGTFHPALQGTGVHGDYCDSLSILNNTMDSRSVGININQGSDARVLDNSIANVNTGINLNTITAVTLPRAVIIQGNTLSGTLGMGTALYINGIHNQVISDGSVAGTNVFMPIAMGHKLFHTYPLRLYNTDRTTVSNVDLGYTGTSAPALQGNGLYADHCDSLSILNLRIDSRRRGVDINQGSDVRILNNTFSNVGYDANHGAIDLNNISSNTLPRSIIVQGNTFTGTVRMYTAIYLTNIHDQVISDGSVTGTNVFMPATMGHQLYHSYPIRLYNTDRTTISNVDLGYTGTFHPALQGTGVHGDYCDSLSILNNTMDSRSVGININQGSDARVLDNSIANVNTGINLNTITAVTLPRAVIIQGNTLSGTLGMGTALYINGIHNQVISDGSVAGTNVFMPIAMGHKLFHTYPLRLYNTDRTTVSNVDLGYTGTSAPALQGNGLYADHCDSLSILNLRIDSRRRGVDINQGSDVRILNNTFSNVGYDANHGAIDLNNISSNTLPRSIIVQGNTFTGTVRMYTAIYLTNIHDQVISDGSVTGTNVFMPSTMGHQLYHSYPIRLYNTDRTTISNVDLGYTGTFHPALQGTGVHGDYCDSLSILNNTMDSRSVGININQGSDARVLDNSISNVNTGINLNTITAVTLPKAVIIQGNTLSGTLGMGTALYINGIHNQVISDGSVAGTNVFMPIAMGHKLFHTYPLRLYNTDRTTVSNVDLGYIGTSAPALQGNGLYADHCDSLSILNLRIDSRRRGVDINQGSDVRILNNTFSNVGYDANHGAIDLNNISSNTLPRSIIVQGNTFTGTVRMYTAIYLTNIHDQVISDGSVTGTNVFMPATMGHQLYHSYPIRLYNTDRTTISNVDLGYTGTFHPALQGTGVHGDYCDSLSILNNTMDSRSVGININQGSDARVLDNSISNVNTGINLNTITAVTLPRAVILEGNIFSGTNGMGTAFYLNNIDHQIISDGSKPNTNIRIQDSDGATLMRSYVMHLENVDTLSISNINVSYIGTSVAGAGLNLRNIEDLEIDSVKVCNRVNGMQLYRCTADTIRNSTISNNTHGIYTQNDSVVVMTSNIMGNVIGIRNVTANAPVLATGNYWNAPDGSTTDGGSGDTYIGNVDASAFSAIKLLTPPVEGTLLATPNAIAGLAATCVAGLADSFQIEGQCLTDDVIIAAPAGFEISLDNITFSDTIILTVAGGAFSPSPDTVYVRIGAGNAGGAIAGNIVISSMDYIQLIAVNGMVTAPSTDLTRGDALDFDGVDDYVSIPSTASLESYVTTGAFTIEMWVNPTNLTNIKTLISNRNVTNTQGFVFEYYSGKLHTWIRYGNSWVEAPIDLVLNEWQHITVVAEANVGIKSYVNGILANSRNVTGTFSPSGGFTALGSNTSTINRLFEGQMDEVRIWNTARTGDEIRENMHLTLDGCENGLVSYYQMNDGTGSTTLTDQTGGNDGTLTNMDAATDWVISEVNVGDDAVNNSVSQTMTAVATGGSTQNFASANLSMNVRVHSAVENITVTYQEFAPNAITGANGISIISNPMWTVNTSTSTATLLADYTFTYPSAVIVGTTPTKYALYNRAMNSSGDWTKVKTAAAITGTSATFTSISMTGQFMIVQESDVLVSDVRGNMYDMSGVSGSVLIPGTSKVSAASLGLGGSITVEAWCKPNSNGNYRNLVNFVQDNGGSEHGFELGFGLGGLRARVAGGTAGLVNTAEHPIPLNEWSYCAFTYDGTTIRLYHNGVLVNSTVETGAISYIDSWLSIGAYKDDNENYYFDGAIDEVRIWTTARSEAELRENMHLTLKGNETGLIHYYQFNNDASVGTVGGVKDAMGNNDGETVNLLSTTQVPSEVAVAGGTSDRMTIGAGGVYNFPNTDVDIDFGTTTPNGEIVVYRLETEKPHGWGSITGDVDNEYFVIENFGANTTFSALNDITFNRLNYVSPLDAGLPQASSPLHLYKRGDNDFGATWGASWGGADDVTSGTAGSVGYNASNNLTSFSQIVIVNAGQNSDLPVELLNFDAERLNAEKVQLDWATATELNNEGFFIERMLESETSFESIDFVEGQGTTLNTTNYRFLDNNSYTGVNYYRLRQVDYDGTTTYSEIKAVRGIENQSTAYLDVNVYPNPVNDILKIRFDELPKTIKRARVSILSIDGRVLHDFVAGIQAYQVLEIESVQNLAPAMYMISIKMDNGERIMKKFIKE